MISPKTADILRALLLLNDAWTPCLISVTCKINSPAIGPIAACAVFLTSIWSRKQGMASRVENQNKNYFYNSLLRQHCTLFFILVFHHNL